MMKKFCLGLSGLVLALLSSACSGAGKDGNRDLPKDFQGRSDEQKVAYMMEAVEPDSVARFIVYSSLSSDPEVRIGSLSSAYNYAYQHYQNMGDRQEKFILEFEQLSGELPLDERMRLMKAAGQEDSLGLGLRLGIEYFKALREKKMTLQQVDGEIAAFRRACGNDTATYVRFVKGFKAALNTDGGRSVDRAVYAKYAAYPESM
jgi:lipoprotein